MHFTLLEEHINEEVRVKRDWPVVINLRADPYERMWQESQMYLRWAVDQMWTYVPAQQYVARFLATFQEFPPVRGSSLSVDQVLQELQQQGTGR